MYRPSEKQLSVYRYLRTYRGELYAQNRWVRLADALDWDAYERLYSTQFAPGGKVALPARLAFGCRIIQLYYRISDRELVELIRESPYLQYFIGLDSFGDAVPFSVRTVARFRERIPDALVRPAVKQLRAQESEAE